MRVINTFKVDPKCQLYYSELFIGYLVLVDTFDT